MVEEHKILNFKGQEVGSVKGNVYYTSREPRHIFRKFNGFGISKDILDRLDNLGVDTVVLELKRSDGKKTYKIPLKMYIESKKTYLHKENGHNDLQHFVSRNEIPEEEFDLGEKIDEYLEEKEISKTGRVRDYFYMSELGRSKKEIYKSIKSGEPKMFSPRVVRILDNGNSVHERYVRYLSEAGLLVSAEISVNIEDLIHGRYDAIISDRKKNYLVELKSCSMWVFNKLKEPMLNHKIQLQMYLYGTGLEEGIILYENKDNQAIKTFKVKLNKKFVEKYLDELRKLKEDIDKGIEPPDEEIKIGDLEYGI